LGGEAAGRVLRLHRDDVRHQGARFAAGRVVARDQRDSGAEMPGEVRVQRRLADGLAVEAALEDRATRVGVIEHRLRMPRTAVIADEEAGVVSAVDALAHAPRLRGPDDELGAWIEIIGEDVVHRAVRVVHAEPARSPARRTVDARVRLVRHPLARALVLDALHHHLRVRRDAADAFHVDRDPHTRGGALRHERDGRRSKPTVPTAGLEPAPAYADRLLKTAP